MWRRRVRAALTELAHDLRDHATLTEAEGGLYADIGATAPRLTHGVEVQLGEHAEALAEVERLLAERDEGMPTTPMPSTRTARRASGCSGGSCGTGSARSDLIYEAYAVDIGGSG